MVGKSLSRSLVVNLYMEEPKKEDFLVFIYNPNDNTLWQISHKQILEDVINKVQENKDKAKVFLTLMEKHIMEKNLPIL